MKSQVRGKDISRTEVQGISAQGIWLFVGGREYFLSYKKFPWFQKARVTEIYNVDHVSTNHLHWPDLDIDLEVDSLAHPEKYPLTYKK